LHRLPDIHKELKAQIQNTENLIRKLPKPPPDDPFGEVLHLITNFTRDLSRHLEGTSDPDGLLQTIKPTQRQFQRAIRTTAPKFRPFERGPTTSAPRTLTPPEFLTNESENNKDFEANNSGNPIYVDEVLTRAQEYVDFLTTSPRFVKLCLPGQ